MTAFPRCPECNGQRVPMNYVGDVVGAVCYCGFARRAEPSTSFEDVYRTQTAEITRLRAEVEALKAELARLTPMMRLEPTGWEFLDWIEPDFLTSIPQGTQLYMIDAARAAQGVE